MIHPPSILPCDIYFSKRQLEVIAAWGECPNPMELARRLGMSVHTVQTHLKRMRRKLGVKRTVEVWMWWMQSVRKEDWTAYLSSVNMSIAQKMQS